MRSPRIFLGLVESKGKKVKIPYFESLGKGGWRDVKNLAALRGILLCGDANLWGDGQRQKGQRYLLWLKRAKGRARSCSQWPFDDSRIRETFQLRSSLDRVGLFEGWGHSFVPHLILFLSRLPWKSSQEETIIFQSSRTHLRSRFLSFTDSSFGLECK